MKFCGRCKKTKDESDFYCNKSKTKSDQLSARCKTCHNEIQALWRASRPDYMKNYATKNRVETKKKYGISVKTIERHGFENALKVYERCKRACVQCGTEFDLTIHHKDHKGRNQMDVKGEVNNDPDNLVILCRSCHGRMHSLERWRPPKS